MSSGQSAAGHRHVAMTNRQYAVALSRAFAGALIFSLPRLLPGRRHIVLTRNRAWTAEGAEIVHDVDEALDIAGDGPLSVIGGAEIFGLFLPIATRIELTEVLADYEGETAMPDPRHSGAWLEIHREEHPAEGARPPFRFITLKRAPI